MNVRKEIDQLVTSHWFFGTYLARKWREKTLVLSNSRQTTLLVGVVSSPTLVLMNFAFRLDVQCLALANLPECMLN